MNLNNTDPRPGFAAAGATALAVIGQLRPEQLAGPTPCEEFDVRTLLGHLLVGLRRPTALALGADPMTLPQFVSGIADDAWAATFAADLAACQDAWADDAVLERPMSLPWVTAPGRGMLPTYTSELTVHTWDLGQATGIEPHWDAAVLEEALAAALRLLPEGKRESMTLPNGMPIPFASAVEISADAPTIDRLIAWYGRNPA